MNKHIIIGSLHTFCLHWVTGEGLSPEHMHLHQLSLPHKLKQYHSHLVQPRYGQTTLLARLPGIQSSAHSLIFLHVDL